ncbi:MAG: aminoglycoside phosphotransferase family protein [Pseudonocardiales bacterium]|nr:aminoglycoside phosphotransferase family protein [Pseudonocardiales bacterium]
MMHKDDIDIDLALVRALVDRARPDLAGLPLRPLEASGSSNRLFRLGDELLVRLPRQPGGSRPIAKEARWLPYIGPALPIAVPEIVTVGEPDLGYPERWSLVRWIDGATPPIGSDDTAAARLARDLAGVVGALAGLDVPPEALTDPALHSYRGEPLSAMDGATRQYLVDCRTLPGLDLDLDGCERVWDEAMTLPDSEPAQRWLHGDLLAENLLVQEGQLAAVLDFGSLAVGDPTVDLVVAWEVLDPEGRELFRSLLGTDDVAWLRGRAWALAIALMTFPYYWQTMPERCAARLVMARAVLADAARRRQGP